MFLLNVCPPFYSLLVLVKFMLYWYVTLRCKMLQCKKYAGKKKITTKLDLVVEYWTSLQHVSLSDSL